MPAPGVALSLSKCDRGPIIIYLIIKIFLEIIPTAISIVFSFSHERFCGCNSVVECQLPKLDVVGSSPITRSFFIHRAQQQFQPEQYKLKIK